MKYKVGDKVRIKSREWYEQNKDENGDVCDMRVSFVEGMAKYCGKIMTISSVDKDGDYDMDEDFGRYCWSDDMIEGLAAEEPTAEEPQSLDLTEILKDCPKGIKLWSPLFGEVEFQKIEEYRDHPIKVVVEKSDFYASFSEKGCYYADYEDAECVLFPSKEQRDWSKFKAPRPDLAVDTPVITFIDGKWELRYYAGKGKVFAPRTRSMYAGQLTWDSDIVVPFDKFNPNDIESNKNSEHNYGMKGGGQ